MLTAVSAVVDISPRVPSVIGCGSGRILPPSPDAGLEANLCLLRDDTGVQILLVSLDALYVGPSIRKDLEAGLSGRLTPEQIFVSATHTHNAPMLDPSKPILGQVNEQHRRWVARELLRSADFMLRNPGKEVEVRFATYAFRHAVSRRRYLPVVIRNGKLLVNQYFFLKSWRSPGLISSEIIEFRSEGEPLCLFWVAPCHPVVFPDLDRLSADYPGAVRTAAREQLGRGLPFLCFQGASGELRPPAYRRWTSHWLPERLMRFLAGRRFGRFDPNQYLTFCRAVVADFLAALGATVLRESEEPQLAYRRKILPLSAYFVSSPEREISLHSLGFAGITLLGISAEPTWKFGRHLLRESSLTEGRGEGGLNAIIVGCLDDTFGYLPSPRQFRQGGYEATGFLGSFSLQRKPKVHLESDILKTCRSILQARMFPTRPKFSHRLRAKLIVAQSDPQTFSHDERPQGLE